MTAIAEAATPRIRVLDLYAGTCSVKKALGDAAIVTSLDNDPKGPAEMKVDVLTFDYKSLWQPGEFEAVWASPPCTEYSVMRNSRAHLPRDLEGADRLVSKALEIIAYLKPRAWFIENPSTGLLKTRAIMQGHPYTTVHYCRYGLRHRKPTRIWSNALEHFEPRMCNAASGYCESTFISPLTGHRVHQESIGAANPRRQAGVVRVNSHDARKAVPQILIRELFGAAGLVAPGPL